MAFRMDQPALDGDARHCHLPLRQSMVRMALSPRRRTGVRISLAQIQDSHERTQPEDFTHHPLHHLYRMDTATRHHAYQRLLLIRPVQIHLQYDFHRLGKHCPRRTAPDIVGAHLSPVLSHDMPHIVTGKQIGRAHV